MSCDLEKKKANDIVDDDSLAAFYWGGEIYPYPYQGINRFEETSVCLMLLDKLRTPEHLKEMIQAWKQDKGVEVIQT